MTTPALLEGVGLRKSFGELVAVRGLDITVRRGEVVGLLGPNGSGKTTSLRMLAGLAAPDIGSVRLSGTRLDRSRSVRRGLGLAPQQAAVYGELSVEQNLRFFASLYGLRGEQAMDGIRDAMAAVDLADRAGQEARHLSGGLRQRLNVACALVHRPEIVLLDEPTAGTDIRSRQRILDVICRLVQDGAAVVLATNEVDEAQAVCDRALVLDHGRVVADDAVDRLLRRVPTRAQLVLDSDVDESMFLGMAEVSRQGSRIEISVWADEDDGELATRLRRVLALLEKSRVGVRGVAGDQGRLARLIDELTGSDGVV